MWAMIEKLRMFFMGWGLRGHGGLAGGHRDPLF